MTLNLSHVRKNTDKPHKIVNLLKTTHGLNIDNTHQNNLTLSKIRGLQTFLKWGEENHNILLVEISS